MTEQNQTSESLVPGFDYATLFATQPTREQLAAIFDDAEADLTYIDDEDHAIYFSPFRIFDRPEQIIGRPVYRCHKTETVPQIKEMLAGFRDGTDFRVSRYTRKNGRYVHVCYMAISGPDGQYRGCLESATYRDDLDPEGSRGATP
jgi:DUF438 domain-containing protein